MVKQALDERLAFCLGPPRDMVSMRCDIKIHTVARLAQLHQLVPAHRQVLRVQHVDEVGIRSSHLSAVEHGVTQDQVLDLALCALVEIQIRCSRVCKRSSLIGPSWGDLMGTQNGVASPASVVRAIHMEETISAENLVSEAVFRNRAAVLANISGVNELHVRCQSVCHSWFDTNSGCIWLVELAGKGFGSYIIYFCSTGGKHAILVHTITNMNN